MLHVDGHTDGHGKASCQLHGTAVIPNIQIHITEFYSDSFKMSLFHVLSHNSY